MSNSGEHAADKPAAMYERKVQAYLPSKEMRDEFVKVAEEESGGISAFVTHLFKLYKRGQLKTPDEARRPA